MIPMDSSRSPNRIQKILTERLPEEIQADRDFNRWFGPLSRRVEVAAVRVIGDVRKALDVARERIFEREGGIRQVWFVTGTEDSLKSAASVRSKLGRELCEQEDAEPLSEGRMSLDQVEKLLFAFPDLGRFRVICDLSLDVKEAIEVLQLKDRLLLGRYPIREYKDFVHDRDLRRRLRGHRAQQLTVEVEEDGRPHRVEIQLMTLLQHAWDRRNHPLYEWEREGGSLPVELWVNDLALAETLHLVDEQAARNWEEFLKIRRGSR